MAFCLDNIQLEGTAAELGHPLDAGNEEVMKLAQLHNGIKSFVKYKNTVLIEVNVTSVEMWTGGKRLFLDVSKRECFMK